MLETRLDTPTGEKMPQLPAECERCGSTFPSSIAADEVDGILVVGDLAIKGVVDRCPRCGGSGRIQYGPSREAAATIILRSSGDVQDLHDLILVLEEMKKQELNRDLVAEHIEERTPRFAALNIFIPSNPGELYGFLGFLTGVAGLLYTHYSAVKNGAEDAQLIREIATQISQERQAPDPGDPSPTRETARPSFSRDPERPDSSRLRVLVREGDEARARRDYEEAIHRYSHALVEDRDDYRVLMARADAYHRLNQLDSALQDLSRVIQLEHNYVQARHERGQIYYEQQRYDLALRDANRAIAMDSNDWVALSLRAAIYNQLTRHRLAFLDADRALELNPNSIRALVERASVHYVFQRNDLALRDANRAVALDSNYPPAWGARAGIYRQMGQYERVLQDLDKALELDPSYKWALHERRKIR